MSTIYTQDDDEPSDPTVTHWLLECGFLKAPVKFRLKAESMADLQLQIDRMNTEFGDEVRIGNPMHNRVGNEYIAYGAFLR